MKIIDRYIFLSFIKTFFAVFVILILIFLLQSIWVYISELAGKDLDFVVIGKLLFYLIPNLIPMVLPLTILVASIMVFGNFAENYEFAAMKSSGISLQRAMRSLIFFISILSVTTFFFANDVIPWSRYKAINLRNNIRKLKPALAIVEGSFNQVADYNIKVGKKTGKNGQDLHDVIIHKKDPKDGELIVIKSKTGKLVGDKNSDVLSLILYEGSLYQNGPVDNMKARLRMPFIKNHFEEYRFNIDLSGLNKVDMDDEQYSNAATMLNLSELRVTLDSLSENFNQDRQNLHNTLSSRNGIERILGTKEELTTHPLEEVLDKHPVLKSVKPEEIPSDTITYDIADLQGFFDSFDDRTKMQMTNLALTTGQGTVRTLEGRRLNFNKKIERLNRTEIEIHDKYALAVMCYVLFFVGAPLGAIIRKGGVGMPMVVAIVLFLVYYYIGMFAKNSAHDGSVSPFVATWISTFIMLPLSVLVTYRATTDQGIFNPDSLLMPIRKFFAKIGLFKAKTENKG